MSAAHKACALMSSVDSLTFRKCLGRFSTGVTVVTSRDQDRIHGMTVNSFTSVSLVPPLVLFCPKNGTRTLDLMKNSGVYAVNILSCEQAWISERFAGMSTDDDDRFAGIEYSEGPLTGCPLLSGCLAHLECRMTDHHKAGDHNICVAEVVGLAVHAETDLAPLLYFSGNYHVFPERVLPRPIAAPAPRKDF